MRVYLVRAHLCSEGIQESDCVHLEQRVDLALDRLEVLEHVVREELHDVHERIRACDSQLGKTAISHSVERGTMG